MVSITAFNASSALAFVIPVRSATEAIKSTFLKFSTGSFTDAFASLTCLAAAADFEEAFFLAPPLATACSSKRCGRPRAVPLTNAEAVFARQRNAEIHKKWTDSDNLMVLILIARIRAADGFLAPTLSTASTSSTSLIGREEEGR